MILDCLCFPWLVVNGGVLVARGPGSLYSLPEAANTPSELRFCCGLRSSGWSESPAGWSTYAVDLSASESSPELEGMLVLPGLQVRGGKCLEQRRPGIPQFCDRGLVSDHVRAVLDSATALNTRFDTINRQNIHEIRGLNASLYNSALELQRILESSSLPIHPKNLAGNLVAFTQVLSARMDLMNFQTDDSLLNSNLSSVQVHPKFLKMVRSFRARASKAGIDLRIEGVSSGSSFGPYGALDLIAYLMLDNALKYSQTGEHILVYLEDLEEEVEVSVTSTGPRIADAEKDMIFEQGFRGQAALSSGVSGSGIGLHALRRLVTEGFSGTIALQTEELDPALMLKLGRQQVSFVLHLPRYEI